MVYGYFLLPQLLIFNKENFKEEGKNVVLLDIKRLSLTPQRSL